MSATVAASGPPRSKARVYVDLARPFTLLPPALGVVSGAVTAWGAGHHKLAGDGWRSCCRSCTAR